MPTDAVATDVWSSTATRPAMKRLPYFRLDCSFSILSSRCRGFGYSEKIGCHRTSAETAGNGNSAAAQIFFFRAYSRLLSTLSRFSARRSAKQHFVLHGLKNPFHERAEPTNDGIVRSQGGGRDRVVDPDFGEGRVPDDKTAGLSVSRGNQMRGRTGDGPALKEYMSSTRSLGLFSARDIRSIV